MKPRPLPALKAPFNTSHPLPSIPVKSSNIASVAYDPAASLLQVSFHSGATYDYHGVPPQIHDALMAAHSKGDFLRTAVTPHFRAVKRARTPGPH